MEVEVDEDVRENEEEESDENGKLGSVEDGCSGL